MSGKITIEKLLDKNVKYGDIFPNDKDKISVVYKELCKQFHPDACGDPRATDAFASLQALYSKASAVVGTGIWEGSKYVEIKTTNGKTLKINYLYHAIFELGEYYVCNENVIYLFDFSKKKYYNNYIEKIKNISYANNDMRNIFEPLMPQIQSEYDTTDNKHIIVLKKTSDVFPLRAVVENFYEGKVPATHMAWMISRLMSLCCFLKYNNQVINGLNLDALGVSLEFHSITILGGFWFATQPGAQMLGTTKDIYAIMPPKVKADKISMFTTDVESVKAFGRKYIADDAPAAVLDFINSGTSEDSYDEMQKWDTALQKGFGTRRFIKIDVNKNKIYKKEN